MRSGRPWLRFPFSLLALSSSASYFNIDNSGCSAGVLVDLEWRAPCQQVPWASELSLGDGLNELAATYRSSWLRALVGLNQRASSAAVMSLTLARWRWPPLGKLAKPPIPSQHPQSQLAYPSSNHDRLHSFLRNKFASKCNDYNHS